MKTTIRTLSVLLALCCLCMLATPALAASFPDVGGLSTEYRDAINYVSDNGIIGGTAEGTFDPNTAVTRAVAVTVLYRMSGDTGTYTEASQFPDVGSGKYFYNAVGWGVANGIVTGAADGYFYPYNTLTFQDLCVFMYRFAKKYGGGTIIDEDISSASDYSNISPYALEAVTWACSYGIKTRSSSTSPISPKTTVPRKDLALYVTRYRLNAEGIVFGRDNFSFSNVTGNFKSYTAGRNCISEEDWDYLYNYAESVSWSALQNLTDNVQGFLSPIPWSGSCYGMSLSMVLDHLGKIDLNGNCGNNCSTINSLVSPAFTASMYSIPVTDKDDPDLIISALESRLNMYQLSQFVFMYETLAWSSYINTSTALKELVDALSHGGLGLLTFSFDDELPNDFDGGHAVVAYGKPVRQGTTYTVSIYDPNNSQTPATLTIDASGSNWTGTLNSRNRTYSFLSCKFEDSYSLFNTFDRDGSVNIETATETEDFYDGKDILMVCATGGFTITNAEGQSFHYAQEEATGDMEVFGKNLLLVSSEAPCVLCFLVEESVDFTCVADEESEIISFSIVSEGVSNAESIEP